jgi:proteasome lid subunit RPN8/RPN11
VSVSDIAVPRALALAPAARAHVLAALARADGREACGALLGRRTGAELIVARGVELPNVAEDADRFEIDPRALAPLVAARPEGEWLVGFWHTHPDAAPRPSRADRAGCWDDHVLLIAGAGGSLAAWWPRGDGFAPLSIEGATP